MSKSDTSAKTREAARLDQGRTPMNDGPSPQSLDDIPDLTDERLAALRGVPRVKTLRRALGLTQEAFAARFAIPLGTLRDWEQGRAAPDQPTRAYLRVIAHDPEAVVSALAKQLA